MRCGILGQFSQDFDKAFSSFKKNSSLPSLTKLNLNLPIPVETIDAELRDLFVDKLARAHNQLYKCGNLLISADAAFRETALFSLFHGSDLLKPEDMERIPQLQQQVLWVQGQLNFIDHSITSLLCLGVYADDCRDSLHQTDLLAAAEQRAQEKLASLKDEASLGRHVVDSLIRVESQLPALLPHLFEAESFFKRDLEFFLERAENAHLMPHIIKKDRETIATIYDLAKIRLPTLVKSLSEFRTAVPTEYEHSLA